LPAQRRAGFLAIPDHRRADRHVRPLSIQDAKARRFSG
jgi:hypothetical protein